MKRCFFITGVECGCNHIVTRLLVDSGCEGEWKVHQPLDEFALGNKPIGEIVIEDKDIVYNRPTGGRNPDLSSIYNRFKDAGYKVEWIVPIRDERYVVASRVIKEVANNHQTVEDVRDDYEHIRKHVSFCKAKAWQFSVKQIYNDIDGFIKEVHDRYELTIPKEARDYIYDGDKKYEEYVKSS